MVDPKDYLELGLQFHGHKCPAMPLGLRMGAAAMNKLGIERTRDSKWLALVEMSENHFATCYADGIQVITGCTFGKDNIKKLNYGKWGLTLVNKETKKAVRVAVKGEVIAQNMKSAFFAEYYSLGVPPSKIPTEISESLIDKVMSAPNEMILNIGEVFDYPYQEKFSFTSFICEECGEMTVEQFGRVKGGKKVCSVCLGWD